MESSSWPENLPSNRVKAIEELTKGEGSIDQLRELLYQPEKIESDTRLVNGVLDKIYRMFDNSISILNSSSLVGIPHNPTSDVRSPSSWDDQKSEDSGESIKTIKAVKTKRGCYKRRKNASTVTKVTSTLIDDGYAWRKYGQKVILNSKHQRNYYRCSHKFEQGCQATKQVQKTDDEPSKYMITYNGLHTCNTLQQTPQIIVEAPNLMDNSTLISFETNKCVENNTLRTAFPYMKHTPKEDFLSSGHLKREQVTSLDCHTSWDPIMGLTQVQLEPISMELSTGVFSSTYDTKCYEIDDMIDSHDFGDFHFELCS